MGKKPGFEVIEDGIPEDAKIVDCKYDGFQNIEGAGTIIILLESESFPEVEEGKEYSILLPTISKLKIKDETNS